MEAFVVIAVEHFLEERTKVLKIHNLNVKMVEIV